MVHASSTGNTAVHGLLLMLARMAAQDLSGDYAEEKFHSVHPDRLRRVEFCRSRYIKAQPENDQYRKD